MTKVLIKYKDDKDMNTNIYTTVTVDNSISKECPKLLAINSFDLDWYKDKTILDVEVL